MNSAGNNKILAQWWKYPRVCRGIRVRLENNGFFIQPKYPLIPLARELQKKNDTLCPLSKSARLPALFFSQPKQLNTRKREYLQKHKKRNYDTFLRANRMNYSNLQQVEAITNYFGSHMTST